MEPILKWAGGKRKLVKEIIELINLDELKGHRLFEPFVGGGSLSLFLEHNKTSLNDLNAELINVYLMIKNNPKELIDELKIHAKNHCKDYYYKIRNLDRTPSFKKMSDLKKAARVIYLNRTCFNGLYRVNSKGYFNVPVGYSTSKKTEMVFTERIKSISKFLNKPNVELTNCDFEEAVSKAKKGDYVYFDPPYDYEPSGFTSYTSSGFEHKDLLRLRDLCKKLIAKGVHIIVSNNATKYVNKIFKSEEFNLKYIDVQRHISAKNSGRRKVREVLIYG